MCHQLRLIVAATFCVLAVPGLLAGDKGDRKEFKGPGQDFEFIKKHEKELNLTSEQKKKISELEKKSEKLRDKMKSDPDTRKLFMEVKEARSAGDEARLEKLHGKIKEMMEKQNGGETMLGELRNILAPQQLIKLKELRESEGMKGIRERRAEKGKTPSKEPERPDPSKGAPSLYDNEK